MAKVEPISTTQVEQLEAADNPMRQESKTSREDKPASQSAQELGKQQSPDGEDGDDQPERYDSENGVKAVLSSAGRSGNIRSSRLSSRVSVAGEEIDESRMDNLWKAVHAAEQVFCWNVFCSFIVGVQLAYVLNTYITGDRNTANSESQSWYSACVSVRALVYVLMSTFVTSGGSWWGRKAMLRIAQLSMIGVTIVCCVAHVLEAPALLLLANALSGGSSGERATISAYVADVSTIDTHKGNIACFALWGSGGMTLAMIVFLFLDVMPCYVSGGVAIVVSFLVREWVAPDVSPPVNKRAKPSSRDILTTLVPCSLYPLFKPQSAYTKGLLMTQFCQMASGGAMHAWYMNYVLVAFNMNDKAAGYWIFLCGVISAIVTWAGLKTLPITATPYLMWMTPLFNAFILYDFGFGSATMWIAFIFWCPRLVPLAQLDTIYYGQVSARKRHELAALENMIERIGMLVGGVCVTIYSPFWMENFQDGDGSLPGLPVVSLIFDCGVVFCFYVIAYRARASNNYGKHFMILSASKADLGSCPVIPTGSKVRVKKTEDHDAGVGVCGGKIEDGASQGGYRITLDNGDYLEVRPEDLELIKDDASK